MRVGYERIKIALGNILPPPKPDHVEKLNRRWLEFDWIAGQVSRK